MCRQRIYIIAGVLLATVLTGGSGRASGQKGDQGVQRQSREGKEKGAAFYGGRAKLYAEESQLEGPGALDEAKTTTPQDLTDLQSRQALADAAKALADVLKTLSQSENPMSQQLSELQSDKAIADELQKGLDRPSSVSPQQLTNLLNQKAIADAVKAATDAQSQAALAKYIGDVKAGPYSGTVDMKQNAGTEEAVLLGSRAVREAGGKIAAAIKRVASSPAEIHIFAAKEFPNFQRLRTYRLKKEMVKQAFTAVGISKPSSGTRAELVTPGLVSSGLDAFAKILGFFKTDYSIGGIDVKLDGSALLYAVAGQLTDKTVHLPLAYAPAASTSAISALAGELVELVNLRQRAATALADVKKQIAAIESQVANPQNSNKDTVANLKTTADQLTGVIAIYDTFATSLTNPDPTGAIPVSIMIQEHAIDRALAHGAGALLLRLENMGGGYLMKKKVTHRTMEDASIPHGRGYGFLSITQWCRRQNARCRRGPGIWRVH